MKACKVCSGDLDYHSMEQLENCNRQKQALEILAREEERKARRRQNLTNNLLVRNKVTCPTCGTSHEKDPGPF